MKTDNLFTIMKTAKVTIIAALLLCGLVSALPATAMAEELSPGITLNMGARRAGSGSNFGTPFTTNPGSKIEYKVVLVNQTGAPLDKVKVKVTIPYKLVVKPPMNITTTDGTNVALTKDWDAAYGTLVASSLGSGATLTMTFTTSSYTTIKPGTCLSPVVNFTSSSLSRTQQVKAKACFSTGTDLGSGLTGGGDVLNGTPTPTPTPTQEVYSNVLPQTGGASAAGAASAVMALVYGANLTLRSYNNKKMWERRVRGITVR